MPLLFWCPLKRDPLYNKFVGMPARWEFSGGGGSMIFCGISNPTFFLVFFVVCLPTNKKIHTEPARTLFHLKKNTLTPWQYKAVCDWIIFQLPVKLTNSKPPFLNAFGWKSFPNMAAVKTVVAGAVLRRVRSLFSVSDCSSYFTPVLIARKVHTRGMI